MNKPKIFIACDTSSIKKLNKIISETKTDKLDIGYKIGFEFFFSPNGRKLLTKLKNKEFFLDLKLNDIPNTCVAAIKSLKDLRNIRYITVHASGGLDMLKAIKKVSKTTNRKLKVLAVTILTSFSNQSIKKIGHTKSIGQLVKQQALIAKQANLDGIVCSAHEIYKVRKICKRMEIITPGIRFSDDKYQDQKRVMTPKNAFKNGSTAIVMGRSLTKGNIKKNIQKLINSLK